MKKALILSASLFLFSMPAMASGTDDGGHDTKNTSHDQGMMTDHGHEMMTTGQPGKASQTNRTVRVEMLETEDGKMTFTPANLKVKKGETVRFKIVNKGELEHEFVLDTHKEIMKHKGVMEKFPEMEHDDPNSIRLESGKKGDIYWNFSNTGNFEFACLVPGHYEAGMTGKISVTK